MSGAHCGSAVKSESMKSFRCDEGSLRFRPVDREEGSVDSGTVVGGVLWVSRRVLGPGLEAGGGGGWGRGPRLVWGEAGGVIGPVALPHSQKPGCGADREG